MDNFCEETTLKTSYEIKRFMFHQNIIIIKKKKNISLFCNKSQLVHNDI